MLNIDVSATLPDGRSIAALDFAERIDEWFKYHELNAYQRACVEGVRAKARELAECIGQVVPNCADKSAAIRLLREAVMTANAAISTHGV